MTKRRVGVLLATYNSEAFLLEQLWSIINSVPTPSAIIVSDDNSTDSTDSILESVSRECSTKNIKLTVKKNSSGNSGVHGNFENLLRLGLASDLEVFLLCDHDDIWFEGRVSKSLEALGVLEGSGNDQSSLPALIFSDLEVISEEGSLIAPSFARYQGLPDPRGQPLNRLLHQNVVTGCTTCFNRALLEVATPVPNSVVMHDHWLALCAKVFGNWHYLDEPLVRYRQHGSNTVGAKRQHRSGVSVWLDPVFLRALAIFPWHFAQSIEQARALLTRVEKLDSFVSKMDVETIAEFGGLTKLGVRKRIREGSKWVSMGQGILERTYLNLVFIFLPYLKVRKITNDV